MFYLEIIHHCFSDPELMVYCCDFSATAVDLVKVRHHFVAFLSSADFFQNQLFWKNSFRNTQGTHRLEKYLNIQDYLEKYLKIKVVLKST